jgi:tRNA 2-thiouridine synthesizing protein E
MEFTMKQPIPDTDNEGYLLNPDEWNEAIALAIAELENIDMTAAHWEVVHFVRDYFEQAQSVPENRTLLKMLRERHGREIATRRYVQNLFPYGFGQQACKIAGMRKPLKLLLDL